MILYIYDNGDASAAGRFLAHLAARNQNRNCINRYRFLHKAVVQRALCLSFFHSRAAVTPLLRFTARQKVEVFSDAIEKLIENSDSINRVRVPADSLSLSLSLLSAGAMINHRSLPPRPAS